VNLREKLKQYRGTDLKTVAYWGLPIYWLILLTHFFTLELKLTFANKIRFSPHQIAFHVKHSKNTFILVACAPDKGLVRLYPGHQILELVDSGLKLEPLAQGWDACQFELERLGAYRKDSLFP
jgi:hypothetical protein